MGPGVLDSTETDNFLWRRGGVLGLAYLIITSRARGSSHFWALSQTKRKLVACSRLRDIPDFILEQVVKIMIKYCDPELLRKEQLLKGTFL